MDSQRFDELTCAIAGGFSRRRLVRHVARIMAAGLATPLGSASVAAGPRCWDVGDTCGRGQGGLKQCCSGVCCRGSCCAEGTQCVEGACCPSLQTCGDICCPPENVGCTQNMLPDGTVLIGCLCPVGKVYDRARNACICATTCDTDDECCSGKCCASVCCAAVGQVCCGGVCSTLDQCVCPPGTSCGGSASCTRCGQTYTTEGQCCPYPQVGWCCTDSAPGAGDGFALCCTPNVDCPPCPATGSASAHGFSLIGCCEDDPACTDDCCFHDFIAGSAYVEAPCCVAAGKPCDRRLPCCGKCIGGACVCLQPGEACSQTSAECCAGLLCNIGIGTCV